MGGDLGGVVVEIVIEGVVGGGALGRGGFRRCISNDGSEGNGALWLEAKDQEAVVDGRPSSVFRAEEGVDVGGEDGANSVAMPCGTA